MNIGDQVRVKKLSVLPGFLRTLNNWSISEKRLIGKTGEIKEIGDTPDLFYVKLSDTNEVIPLFGECLETIDDTVYIKIKVKNDIMYAEMNCGKRSNKITVGDNALDAAIICIESLREKLTTETGYNGKVMCIVGDGIKFMNSQLYTFKNGVCRLSDGTSSKKYDTFAELNQDNIMVIEVEGEN